VASTGAVTAAGPATVPVAVIVLTLNEELNLPAALASVAGWAEQVFVVDSFSSDSTPSVASDHGAEVYRHEFEHWSTQRNWALDNLPFHTPWVLFLDADEQLTSELALEATQALRSVADQVAGFYVSRRFIFLGRWLKGGGLWPNHVLRLVRRDRVRVEKIGAWEYFRVDGETLTLSGSLLHDDRKGVTDWVSKHNGYASAEAHAIVSDTRSVTTSKAQGSLEHQRQVTLRKHVWLRLPLLIRPWLLFIYRYGVQLGFLDGIPGFLYCFLHDLWFPLLVAAKVRELRLSGGGIALRRED